MFKKLLLLLIILFSSTLCFAQTISQKIDLKPGFNFIGFTLKPAITPQNLKTQYPVIEEIYAFSTASGSFISVNDGTLATFNANKGYIIKANTQLSLNVEGDSSQVNDSIALKQGFNLLGISRISETVTFSVLMKNHSEIKGIYKWSNSSGAFIQVILNSSGEPELLDGIDPTITPGQAYFVNVIRDTTISLGSSIPVSQDVIIESQSKSITAEGGTLALKNGIILDIPANSVSIPAPASLSLVKDNAFNVTCQNAIRIEISDQIKNGIIKIPVKQGITTDNIAVVSLSDDRNAYRYLQGKIDVATNSFVVDMSANADVILKTSKILRSVDRQTTVKQNQFNIIIEKYDPLQWSIKDKNDNEYEMFMQMPKYQQYNDDTCWAASLLMFIKGYTKVIPEKYNSIYKILKELGIPKKAINTIWRFTPWAPPEYGLYYFLGPNVNFPEIVKRLFGYSLEEKQWFLKQNFTSYVFQKISEKKPVMIYAPRHACVISGFKMPKYANIIDMFNNMQFTITDPADSIGQTNKLPYKYVSYEEIYKWRVNGLFAVIPNLPQISTMTYVIDTPMPESNPLQTIHMPDSAYYEPNNTTIYGIMFSKNSNISDYIEWNHLQPDGYKFSSNPLKPEINDFDVINLAAPIYNGARNTKATVKVKVSVSINGTNIYKYPTDSAPSEIGNVYFDINATYYKWGLDIKKTDFNAGWEKLGSNFLVKVDLYDSNNEVIGGFDFKFNYSALSIDVGESALKPNETRKFKALLAGQETIDTKWSIVSDGTDKVGAFLLAANGYYRAPDVSTIKNVKIVVETTNPVRYAETIITIKPENTPYPNAKLTITPENPILYAGEEQTFTATIAGLTSSEKVYYKWNCSAYQWYDGGSFSSDGPNSSYKAPNEAVGGVLKVYAKIGKDFSGPDDWTADYLVETNITVKKPGITVLPNPISLGINERMKFTATVTDNVKNYPITWQLDNSLKGNISSDGYYDAPSSLASSKPETNIVIAKIGKFEDRANITINNVEIKIQQPVLLMPNSVFSFSALAEGAYNKDVEVTASEGVVTKKAPMSFEFTSPKYNELFYDDDAHINVTVKSEATKVEKTVVFIVARPRRKEMIEYYPGNINIKEKYEAIVRNELQLDNTIVEKFWFKHGFYEKYNTAGKTIVEGNYYLTKVSGKWTTYQDNGSIIDITTYKPDGGMDLYGSGVKHGYSAKYYDSGRIEWECNYIDNIINNEWKSYYDTLNDNPVHRLKESGSYNNGLKTGIWGEWHEDGQKKAEGEYKIYTDNTGVLVCGENGTWTKWYPDQLHHLNSIATYKNGVLDGPYTYWIGDNIYMKGNYTNGQKTGTWLEDTQTKIY